MIWRGCSMRTSADGSTTTVGSTRRRSTRPYGPSTSFWRDGPIGSSSPCAGTRRGPSTGCNASRAARPACSLIGPCSLDAAEQWEPYDARVSRTVLRERGGPAMPRFQPPPRRTQHADFSHCALLFASPQGLWDLSCRSGFRRWSNHSVAIEQLQSLVQPSPTPVDGMRVGELHPSRGSSLFL